MASCLNGHVCRIMLTVGYTMDTVYFSWLETPVEVDADLQLPQFELEYTTQRDCSQNYTAGMIKPYLGQVAWWRNG